MPKVVSTHQVPSDSNPRRSYTVTVYDTYAHCSCPAWRNMKAPDEERTCKHVESITGELRKGDAQLTDAEWYWVMRRLPEITDLSFQVIADAVERAFQGEALSDYERQLAANIIVALRGSEERVADQAPGPDARQALGIIQRALNVHGP